MIEIAAYTQNGVIFHTDGLDVLRGLKTKSVDLVFADPPFNLGKDYGTGRSDSLRTDDYLKWSYEWLSQAGRVLKDGGSLFVYNLPEWNVHYAHYLVNRQRLILRHWIAISMKNGFTRPKHLYPAHYSLLYLTKGDPKTFNPDDVRYPIPICRHCKKPIPDWGGYKARMNPKGINLSDIWTDLSPVRHKTTKKRPFGINELPTKIPERAILLATDPGDIVVDPFGGSGSTYEVAESLGRRWIGSEIGNCAPIIERLSDHTVRCVEHQSYVPADLDKAFKGGFIRRVCRTRPIPCEASL